MINWINKKRNKKGFTLVELVVVIAILGILAAIAVPKFTDVTSNAKKAAAESEHKVIVSAFQMAQAAHAENKLPENKGQLDDFLDITETETSTDNKWITKNATHEITWGVKADGTNAAIKCKISTVTKGVANSTFETTLD